MRLTTSRTGKTDFWADNTPEAFAGRILEAVADRGRLKAIGKTASRTLYTTWAQATALLENEYRRIIEERRNADQIKSAT